MYSEADTCRKSVLPRLTQEEFSETIQLFDKTETMRGRLYYLSQAYGRLHRHGIAQTITAHFSNPGSGRFIHYRDHRSMTVREAARFQGFDDNFVFCGKLEDQQKQVGNAVPPLLARALAEHFGSTVLSQNALGGSRALIAA